jgi:hypothetical protein
MVPSLRTHGIIGLLVSILHVAAGVAFGVGATVIVGLALIHYFQGSCGILDCFNQGPFPDWFFLLLFILISLKFIQRLIVRRHKRRDSAAS